MIPGWDKRSQRQEEVKEGYRVRRMERGGKGRKKAMGTEGEVKKKKAASAFPGAQILFPEFPTGLLLAGSEHPDLQEESVRDGRAKGSFRSVPRHPMHYALYPLEPGFPSF